MAENLVSKFTVNSHGTDIDVKIKDTDARNLIAQEISDRDSAVTTITNNLNKEISDRSALISKDTEGNTNVTSTNGNVNIIGQNITSNTGELYLNTTNPIKYSQPVSKLNECFNTVPYLDNNGNEYNVLCDNGNTKNLQPAFKNYILVGDSYASGYSPDGNTTGWPVLLNNLLNGNLYATIAQNGGGLSDKITGEYNLTTRISELTNSDKVDSIICCCGRNDINNDNISGINNGIKNFVNACHQKFKNAKVYIGFIGWDLNNYQPWYSKEKSLALRNGIAEYQKVTSDYTYINTDFILRQRSYIASDSQHPNQDGQNALAYGIKCALYGGTPSFTKPFVQHRYKDPYGDNQYLINETFTGGITFLQFISGSLEYKAPNETVAFGGYGLTIVKNIELEYLVPSGFGLTSMNTRILVKMTDNSYYTFDAPVIFEDNSDGTYDLKIVFTEVSANGLDWGRGVISTIQIFSSIPVANPLT